MKIIPILVRLQRPTRTQAQFSKVFFEDIGNVVVGQNRVVEQIVIAILCEGHALVESNPGLGKTLMISTVSKAMNLKFSRIQCTPDLMPSDITGTNVIEEQDNKKKNSGSSQGRSLQMLFLRMRLTGHPLRPSQPCWKLCRKNR